VKWDTGAVATTPRLFEHPPVRIVPGAVHLPGWLDADGQRDLVNRCRDWTAAAGGVRAPRLPRRGVMSVQIACLGWHWYPYRYSRTVDDDDGRPVPPFPEELGELSRQAVADAGAIDASLTDESAGGGGPTGAYRPDVALINWYGPGSKMGMHADRDEKCPAPVVSLSLGDTCVFRFGTEADRGRPRTDVLLESGDLFVFGGPARLCFHGVPKVLPGTSDLGVGLVGGRFNITIRQSGLADPAPEAIPS
jgi:alkylated DNA repair protein (DNA oxidative demethylase)